MKHFLKRALATAFIFCTAYMTTYAEPMKLTYDGQTQIYNFAPINLYIDNQPIQTTIMPPIQLGERVVVPAREVFEPMGATVDWKADENKVYVYDTMSLLVLEVDANEAFVNGQMKPLDMPPKIINNKLMIPIRFISEQLGYEVIWQGEQRNVLINKPAPPPPAILDPVPIMPEVTIPNEQQQPTEFIPEFVPDIPPAWENTLAQIEYDYYGNTLILKKTEQLSVNNISVIDLYRERKLIIQLNGDYSAFFTGGSLASKESRVKSVTLDHTGGTRLIVDTQTISAVNLYEQDNQIHIQFVKPSEKYNQIVVIDPGHGGDDPGAISAGVREKDLNMRYAMDVYQLLLNDPNIKVYITRETDVKPSLLERATWSNEIGAHLFISIHNNAAANKAVNGTETYYFSNPDDRRSENFAKMIQANMVQGLNMNDRKAKAGNSLSVLRNTTMPAVLLEIGFMTNTQDLNRLTQPDFSPRLARIIYNSVVTYFANGSHLIQ